MENSIREEVLRCDDHHAMESTPINLSYEQPQVKDRFYFRAGIARYQDEEPNIDLIQIINEELIKLSKKYNLSIQALEFNTNY